MDPTRPQGLFHTTLILMPQFQCSGRKWPSEISFITSGVTYSVVITSPFISIFSTMFHHSRERVKEILFLSYTLSHKKLRMIAVPPGFEVQ